MIHDDIIKVLQYIPETRLNELYELIHSFRLGFNNESRKPAEDPSLAGCLKKLQRGLYSNGSSSTTSMGSGN